jgi:hypothetical protein
MSNIGAVFNATLYKYQFVVDLADQHQRKVPKIYIHVFMVTTQFILPAGGILLALKVDWRPAKILEESKVVRFNND